MKVPLLFLEVFLSVVTGTAPDLLGLWGPCGGGRHAHSLRPEPEFRDT